jgi:hypothetical protein
LRHRRCHPAGLRYTIQGNSVQTQRWGDQTDEKTFALIPFGGHPKEERRFGDYTIPTLVSVGWWYGTERYAEHEFFRATIHSAEFR